MRLYDFVLFNNEFDILDLRLRYMSEFVDKFYICEGDVTYKGDPKPFHSISFIGANSFARELVDAGRLKFVSLKLDSTRSCFGIEADHRDQFSDWVNANIEKDFIGLFGDCDEIISEDVALQCGGFRGVGSLEMKLFYFAADNLSFNQAWNSSKVFSSDVLEQTNFQALRVSSCRTLLKNMGWHFSSFGGIAQVIDKINSFSHQEFNNLGHASEDVLRERIADRRDYLNRAEFPCRHFDLNSYPPRLKALLEKRPLLARLEYLDRDASLQKPQVPKPQNERRSSHKSASRLLGPKKIRTGTSSRSGVEAIMRSDLWRNRSEIINDLICLCGVERYLEIGLGDGDHFQRVQCNYKTSVDPSVQYSARGQPIFLMTSDEFFAQNREQYDLVFIDGLHHADQVERDIGNALACLRENGVVVCHDISPLTEEMQIVPRLQDEWTGDCWKAWIKFRSAHPEVPTVVANCDYGVGIILPGRKRQAGFEGVASKDLSWYCLERNRESWLNLLPPREARKFVIANFGGQSLTRQCYRCCFSGRPF